MKKTLKGLLELTKINEFFNFVILSSFLGVVAAGGSFNWQLLVLLFANWLAAGFANILHHIEDAPDDALNTLENTHNPIATGSLSPKTAKFTGLIVVILSLTLFTLLGTWPLILGLTTLVMGFLTAYRGIRLNTNPVFDLLSYALMLGGLPFLVGFSSFDKNPYRMLSWPFIFIMAISVYRRIRNPRKHSSGETPESRRQSGSQLSERSRQILTWIMLVTALFSGLVSLIQIELIPTWVAVLIVILMVIFSLPRVIKSLSTTSSIPIRGAFHKPLESAAALGLVLQLLLPWLVQFLPFLRF